jgi:hypothetical protein
MFGRRPKGAWLKKVILNETIVRNAIYQIGFLLNNDSRKKPNILLSIEDESTEQQFSNNFFAKGLSSLQPDMQPIRIVDS